MSAQALMAGAGGAQGITGALVNIFGKSSTTRGNVSETGSKAAKGKTTEQLQIDEVGIQKLLQDILGSQQGLASVFTPEKVSGLYGSTVSAQASGNLMANLAGEIAKLTAKKVATTEEEATSTTKQKSKQKEGSDGLLGQIKGLFS